MTSFTEKAHEAFASILTEPCEWPEVVVRNSNVSPELGTQANPILIGDDLAPLGSASNPIVIHVNEGWYGDEPDRLGSDADTGIMATPEFWETLIGRNLAGPVDEGEAVDSSSVRAPTRSLVCEDPEDLRSFEQSTPNCFHLDDKALKVAEISFDASQICSGPGAARSENVAIGHADGEQSMEKGKVFEAEEPREARSVPETSSMTRDAVPQETTVQTDISLERGHPAISTTIGDELAAIYDHVDHCRNADCLHAEAFYDEMQSPQVTMPSNSNWTKQQQEPSTEGRVTVRLYVPDFQKGATWPERFIVNQVAIRRALFMPRSASSIVDCKQDDILFGRGVVLVSLKEANPKCFLTFSPEKNSVYHSTNAPRCGKGPHGVAILESAVPEWQKGASRRHEFIGRVSIELYKTWPPSNSEYEGRQDFFGRVVVSTHSDGADPKCFLAFSSEQSSADRTLHSPASGYQENPAKVAKPRSTHRPTPRRRRHRGNVSQAEEPRELNSVPEPSMTSGAIT